jgi:hypothetical protein
MMRHFRIRELLWQMARGQAVDLKAVIEPHEGQEVITQAKLRELGRE